MENFSQLEKIVDETIYQASHNKNFNLGIFFQQIENEFKNLGFRQPPTGGGLNSILILRLDKVGDFVLTSPAIREIRMNYPNAFITLVVNKGAYPLAEFCPYVNEIIMFDESPNVNDLSQIIHCSTNFCKKYLWNKHFDLAFSFRYWEDGWHILGLFILFMSGAFHRASYIHDAMRLYFGGLLPKEKNISYALLTHPILNPKEIIHDCARSLYLVQAYGLRVLHTDVEVWYNKADLHEAKKLMEGFGKGRIKISVCIGSARVKKYPVEKYLVALKEIIAKGASIIIFGGADEVDEAKFLEDNLPAEFVKNIVKVKAGWRVDAAIMSLTDMYIGSMTGNCDIASALKKPIIALSRVAEKKLSQIFPAKLICIALGKLFRLFYAPNIKLETA